MPPDDLQYILDEHKVWAESAGLEGTCAYLADADLYGSNLANAYLTNADLFEAFLVDSNLTNADLAEANLIRADLSGANLKGADLARAKMWDASLLGGTLEKANLTDADLTGANLSDANLCGACLERTELFRANLSGADLKGANLSGANLAGVNLSGANLSGAKLYSAYLHSANLKDANLAGADFTAADLTKAKLTGANLAGAILERAILTQTELVNANLAQARIYGISAWDLKKEGSIQKDLIITEKNEPVITVDNLEIAQFIHLVLNNHNIREVLDTLTSKSVLILGRFTDQRKAVLEALKDALRERNYLPILFDFEKPGARSLTETISILANMSRFVIADLTDAKSIPQELSHIVPFAPSLPILPIILEGQKRYAMFEHFITYPWVLPLYSYETPEAMLSNIVDQVIKPAEQKVLELRQRANGVH